MKSRKLTPGELELFASAFAITNMALAERVASPTGLKKPLFTIRPSHQQRPWLCVEVPSSDEEYRREAEGLRIAAMSYIAGDVEDPEKGINDEYRSWLRGLRTYTLARIGKTWSDMKDVTDAMEAA